MRSWEGSKGSHEAFLFFRAVSILKYPGRADRVKANVRDVRQSDPRASQRPDRRDYYRVTQLSLEVTRKVRATQHTRLYARSSGGAATTLQSTSRRSPNGVERVATPLCLSLFLFCRSSSHPSSGMGLCVVKPRAGRTRALPPVGSHLVLMTPSGSCSAGKSVNPGAHVEARDEGRRSRGAKGDPCTKRHTVFL